METSRTIQVVSTVHGNFAVDMQTDAKMGDSLARGDYHQEDALKLLSYFVTAQSVVVDVGAHIGTLAVPLAKLAHKVIAFEPAPETFVLLARNVEMNHVSIDVRNKGLGSKSGRATLHVANPHNAGANSLSLETGDIVVSTLDQEVEHADVIKIDAEGMETEILHGGEALVTRSKPVVLFEVNLFQLRAHGTSPALLEKFWRAQGYTLYLPWHTTRGVVLGRIGSLSLISACVTPGAWLFKRGSQPFDVLAVPRHISVPMAVVSSFTTTLRAISEYSKKKFF